MDRHRTKADRWELWVKYTGSKTWLSVATYEARSEAMIHHKALKGSEVVTDTILVGPGESLSQWIKG